jgi:hypothetical protein
MERWNIGFQKDNSDFNFVVNLAGGGTINPTLHYPLRAEGQNAFFQCSIIPTFPSHDLEALDTLGRST